MSDTNIENLPKLVTRIRINAPRSDVWELLADFEGYSRWNTTMHARELPRQVAPGERAAFCAVPGRDWERLFQVEIVRVDPPALLEWQGGVPGTFFGVHRFELQEQGESTLFTNSEFFSGSMVEQMMENHGDAARAEFEEFNKELKRRAESIAHHSAP